MVICATIFFSAAAVSPVAVGIGEYLPDQTLRGLNGPDRFLSSYRGKALLINVWASWCGPCRAEMASLERLSWIDADEGFNIIGISTDDYPERASALLAGSTTTIRHYIDQNLRLEKMLGANRLPLTVLVDAQGRVLLRVFGAKQWDSKELVVFVQKELSGDD